MKQNSIFFLIAASAIMLFFSACKHDPQVTPDPGGNGNGGEECDTLNVTYNATVFPILQQYCIDCHSGTSPDAGLNFNNYDDVAFIAESGQLLGAIRHDAGFSPMPQGGSKLSDCDIAKIAIWVRDTTFVDPNPGGIPCDPDTVYFQNTILPLLQSSCGVSGCHDPGTASDGVILTSYDAIINSGVIKLDDPTGSDLYEVLIDDDPDKRMPPPPRNPLQAEQIAAVLKWIQQGAKNNYCDDEDCDLENVTYSQTISPIIEGRCLGCHSGPNPEGGVSLASHGDVVTWIQNGRLMGAIRHEQGFSAMPKNGAKLSDCNIDQFQKWIDDGTPNN